MSAGKGDTPRPKSVTEAEYADNYARTFSRQIDDPSGYDDRTHYAPPLPDPRELLRRRNLADAERVVLGGNPIADALLKAVGYPAIPCTDWPATDPLPITDPED
jgi:hypothetical protein